MRYISFAIATIFLAIPVTLFASTPTKELRIIDYQLYLFDGNKKIQLTTTWNADIIEWALWEKLSGYESGYSKDECGVKVSMDKCLAIWYWILFQNKDIAIVKRRDYFSQTDRTNIIVLAVNFHNREPVLQDITYLLPLHNIWILIDQSSAIDYRYSRLFADKNGNLVHTLKNSIKENGNVFDYDLDLWYIDAEGREDLKYHGYKERKFWADIVVNHKKISLEKLKNFAWIPLMY